MTLLFTLSSFLVQCTSSPESSKTIVNDTITPANDYTTATPYLVDTVLSVITWIGSKPTGQHNGTIGVKSGRIGIDSGKIVGGDLVFDLKTIAVNDLEKGSERNEKLTNHLLSKDFFFVEQYPTAHFQIVSITPYDTSQQIIDKAEFESDYTPASMSEFMVKEPTHQVTGNLTIRDVTKSISFPAIIRFNGTQLAAEAKFNIDRTLWNLKYNEESPVSEKMKDRFIYNTVNVGFHLITLPK